MVTRVAARESSGTSPALPSQDDGGGDDESSSSSSTKLLKPGTRLGRYELVRHIASGGMAQVWAANQSGDLGFRKVVALKTIRPERASNEAFRRMFLEEARLASRIHHVNVIEITDLGVADGILFQAMPLIDGHSLATLLEGHPMSIGVALRIAVDMLRGLQAAHELTDDEGTELGLVHRDVSPQNILVGRDGVAKLADFGIAKAFGRLTEETNTGQVKGKIGYLAPEQLAGLPPSQASDLFSAGVVLWEMVTATPLFPRDPGDDNANALRARDKIAIRDPRDVSPDVPDEVVRVIMRSLLLDPSARFASATEMADALEACGPLSHRAVALFLADPKSAAKTADIAAEVDHPTIVDVELHAPKQTNARARPLWPIFFVGAIVVVVVILIVRALSFMQSPPSAASADPAAFPPAPALPESPVETAPIAASAVATPPPSIRPSSAATAHTHPHGVVVHGPAAPGASTASPRFESPY